MTRKTLWMLVGGAALLWYVMRKKSGKLGDDFDFGTEDSGYIPTDINVPTTPSYGYSYPGYGTQQPVWYYGQGTQGTQAPIWYYQPNNYGGYGYTSPAMTAQQACAIGGGVWTGATCVSQAQLGYVTQARSQCLSQGGQWIGDAYTGQCMQYTPYTPTPFQYQYQYMTPAQQKRAMNCQARGGTWSGTRCVKQARLSTGQSVVMTIPEGY